MTTSVVMTVEGVLSTGPDLASLPQEQGLILFEALKAGYQITLVTAHERALAEQFLVRNGIKGYASIRFFHDTGLGLEPAAWKAHVVREMQLAMRPVSWFIDSDPVAIQMVFLEGVPTMLLSHPRYIRPDFRPDAKREVRPWGSLVDTLDREKVLAPEGDT